MHNFTYSKEGLALTEQFEGLRLTAYKDVAGLWTIGYGHTGTDVKPGMTITKEQAEALLAQDIKTAADAVNRLVTYAGMTQGQFDALVDFTFNVGVHNFEGSKLLVLINEGHLTEAANQFERWNTAGGQVVAGLLRRRMAEQRLFCEN